MTRCDPIYLSEDEYMNTAWSLDELQNHYRDERYSDIRREHAFYGYWSKWLQNRLDHADTVTHEAIVSLFEYPKWSGPIGQIIEAIVVYDRVSPEEVEWLLTVFKGQFPDRKYTIDQLTARSLLQHPISDWIAAVERLLELRADWAIMILSEQMPIELRGAAKQSIERSDRPRRARNSLLSAFNAST